MGEPFSIPIASRILPEPCRALICAVDVTTANLSGYRKASAGHRSIRESAITIASGFPSSEEGI